MFRNHLSLCALLLALTFTCSSTPNPDQTVLAATDLPTRRTLFNNLRNAKLLTVVHSENESYGAMVDSLAKNPRFDLQIIAKTADKVQLTDLQSGAFFLIGTPQNNPLIQQLSPQLPF